MLKREIAPEDFDPPQAGALLLFGVIGVFGGLLAGFVIALTPLKEAGFVLGCAGGVLLSAWTAWRQGTNAAGVALVLVGAALTGALLFFGFVNSILEGN